MTYGIEYKLAGRFTSREDWMHPTTRIPTWELIYMTEGEAYLFEGEREFYAKAGDAVFLKADTLHGGTKLSDGKVSFIWLHILPRTPEMQSILKDLPTQVTDMLPTQLPVMMRQLLHRAHMNIYPSEANDLLSELIILEYRTFADQRTESRSKERLIQSMCEWIRINSDKPITADALSAEFGYNKDYLTKLLKSATGKGIKAYIDSSKMNRARSLLAASDAPLSQIADLCGFEDYKAFLKFFTYHDGITPTEFRKSCYMTFNNNQ